MAREPKGPKSVEPLTSGAPLPAATFTRDERQAQAAFFERACPEAAGLEESPYRLFAEHRPLNLAPAIRDAAADYFERLHHITWHKHTNHGLSSQVCCLNFLMPLATRPDLLSRLIGDVLKIDPPEMLRIEEGAFGEDWFVGFEWIGENNYLNEAPKSGKPTRGANATSADAVVRFRHQGEVTTLLIEWKYTERYGAPIPPAGNATRILRYKDIAFAPHGPIKSDLGLSVEDFFWEPFYQLLRQQMLADRMRRARESGADRVRVLHISPRNNLALHTVTAPKLREFGDDAFKAFSAVLVDPTDFLSRTTEEVFGPLLADMASDPWAGYLTDRYTFLKSGFAGAAELTGGVVQP